MIWVVFNLHVLWVRSIGIELEHQAGSLNYTKKRTRQL